jgi:hypothetical protein
LHPSPNITGGLRLSDASAVLDHRGKLDLILDRGQIEVSQKVPLLLSILLYPFLRATASWLSPPWNPNMVLLLESVEPKASFIMHEILDFTHYELP